MDDIVAHSKVSKTNIYYHFKSKEELLYVIVEQLVSHYEQRIQHVLQANDRSVLDKLERLCTILAEEAGQHDYLGGCPFLTLYTQTARESSEVRDRIKRFFENQLLAVEQLLADGIARQEISAALSVQSTAALLLSSIEGALFLAKASELAQHHFTSDQGQMESYIRYVLEDLQSPRIRTTTAEVMAALTRPAVSLLQPALWDADKVNILWGDKDTGYAIPQNFRHLSITRIPYGHQFPIEQPKLTAEWIAANLQLPAPVAGA